MITLKHVTIENFRLLREMNLHFPQRGSILIHGPNEAGKSTLFESIYFALYGEPFATNRGMRSLDDLIHYGAASASVTLTLAIGSTQMTITRTIERGKGQEVSLYVQRPGMPEEEPVTSLAVANTRILAELGHMDGETLRNSCFIEQKNLTRLETLKGSEREATLRKLLGLEKLLSLTEQFKLMPHDEKLFTDSAERLRLAQVQARIPVLSAQSGQLEAALDAVSVSTDLEEMRQQEADIAEQQLSLEQLWTRRAELQTHLSRIQQLKKADTILGQILVAYEVIGEARRELPEIEEHIAELDRCEREDLPDIEKHVHELVDLARAFGTLERMSSDLLTTVSTIKELEQELQQYEANQQDSQALEEKIISARLQVEHARQTRNDLEEQRNVGRPQLETRLQRLQGLVGKLTALKQAEEQYARLVLQEGLAEENSLRLRKAHKDLHETEQALALIEKEAREVQKQTDTLEETRRKLSVRGHIEEWQRLKGLSEKLSEAEQHVMAAHGRQGELTDAALKMRRTANTWLMIAVVSGVLGLALGLGTLLTFSHQPVIASVMGLAVVLLLAGAGLSFQNYTRFHRREKIASQQMQDAISEVGMRVAAREAAIRIGGNHEALAQLEYEIRDLESTVPRSQAEAGLLLQQTQDSDESLADIQQQLTEKRNSLSTVRNQINVTMEAVVALRKAVTLLQEQRTNEDWDDIASKLRSERLAIEDMQHEIASLSGQEGLPIPTFGAASAVQASAVTDAELEMLVGDTIKATEREIATLDGKLERAADLSEQVNIHQDALDMLTAQQKVLHEQQERFREQNLMQQIERAREQQNSLRSALQSLQDSLRQRVKSVGVAFGQTAISQAEVVARKQLESLHMTLANRVELQSLQAKYNAALQEQQDALSDYYHQLAKISTSLGSWIVPPNPFAEALLALRTRCQREMMEIDESSILSQLEKLRQREGASEAKIALCQQEIAEAQERIASMLAQHSRARAKGYTFTDVVAVWPLVGQYSAQDCTRLEEERASIEQELSQLEQQEMEISTQLHTGGQKLDVDAARVLMEQHERNYQTRKHASRLISVVNERLMQKMVMRTEHYMQQILSLLTGGRYHDAHLSTDGEEGTVSGGPFQLSVWDAAAGEYVHKSALSGGATDQLSLALRLAFAIAARPKELNTAPGFLLLDEPLSSFDSRRTQALVDVITGEIVGQHFEQVLFISHSNAFSPSVFPYHVYMDGGSIVESNLPTEPILQPPSPPLEDKLSIGV